MGGGVSKGKTPPAIKRGSLVKRESGYLSGGGVTTASGGGAGLRLAGGNRWFLGGVCLLCSAGFSPPAALIGVLGMFIVTSEFFSNPHHCEIPWRAICPSPSGASVRFRTDEMTSRPYAFFARSERTDSVTLQSINKSAAEVTTQLSRESKGEGVAI